jgi:chorismate mutase
MKHADLDSLRKDVAQIDDAIIELLIKRFDVTDEIGRIKNASGIPIENLEVEKKCVERMISNSDGRLDRQLVLDVYASIFASSKERQRKM